MTSSESTPPATLAGQLNRLFEVLRRPDAPERPRTNRDVVTACRAAGWELSESHLSELRRGIKQNPTIRTLNAIAWFFEIRVGYFNDPGVAAEVEQWLDECAAKLQAKHEADQAAAEDLQAANAALQEAMGDRGVTKVNHRGVSGSASVREQASMTWALVRALREDDENDEDSD
jgi:transcriptional regulator with XRE-family HTH domain